MSSSKAVSKEFFKNNYTTFGWKCHCRIERVYQSNKIKFFYIFYIFLHVFILLFIFENEFQGVTKLQYVCLILYELSLYKKSSWKNNNFRIYEKICKNYIRDLNISRIQIVKI